MKIRYTIFALLALAGSAFVAPAKAAVTFTQGDLILAIRGVAEGKTYMVNLGAATGYRDATADINSIVNIKTDLDANFAGWENRSDVTWSLFGVRASSTLAGVVNGDPGQTIYISRAEVPVGVQETAWGVSGQTISSTNHGLTAGQISGVQVEFSGASNLLTTAPASTILLDSETVYDTSGNSWTGFSNSGGSQGNFGAGTAGTALDLFRSLGTTTGASPTGTLRVGSYEGTFHINNLGAVSYTANPTATIVPEPSRAVFLVLGAGSLMLRRRRQAAKA